MSMRMMMVMRMVGIVVGMMGMVKMKAVVGVNFNIPTAVLRKCRQMKGFGVISTNLCNLRFAAICAKLERNICASFGVNSI